MTVPPRPGGEALSADPTPPDVGGALAALLTELVDGTPEEEQSYILNRGDRGLVASLGAVSWQTAAGPGIAGGASIAQHTDHVRYGLSLMNRWLGGEENPFSGADWGASWDLEVSSAAEWHELLGALRDEAHRWVEALRGMGTEPPSHSMALKGVVGSVAHLAYHLGAIRQIAAETRGPREGAP